MTHFEEILSMHAFAHGQIDEHLLPELGHGGKIRAKRGKLVEKLIDYIWEHEFGGYTKTHDYVHHTSRNGNNLKKAMDRHLYLDDTLICCVEAKSYLDACYLARADWDARIVKTQHTDVPCIILSLENGVASETLTYILDEGKLDGVFFLCPGNRSSNRPIWKKEYFKNIEESLYNKFCNYLEECIA